MAANKEDVTPIFKAISPERSRMLINSEVRKTGNRDAYLLRESSTQPGLLAISYLNKERNVIEHKRIGLTDKGWDVAPLPHDKDAFQAFVSKAEMIFAEPEQVSTKLPGLTDFLEELGHKPESRINPEQEEVSKAFSTAYSLMDEEPDSPSP